MSISVCPNGTIKQTIMFFLEGLLWTLLALGAIAVIAAIVFGVQLFLIAITDGHPDASSQQPTDSGRPAGASSSTPGAPGGGR